MVSSPLLLCIILCLCDDHIMWVIWEQMLMQILVERHSCEMLMGKISRSFCEKHLEVFTFE